MADFSKYRQNGPNIKERAVGADIIQSGASAANLGASAAETTAGLRYVAPQKAAEVRRTVAQAVGAEAAAAEAARKAKADADAAAAGAKRAEAQTKFNGLTPEAYNQARGRLGIIMELEKLAAAHQRDFNAYFKDQGIRSAREFIPSFLSPINERYNNRVDRMQQLLKGILGTASKEVDTPLEVQRFRAFLPTSTRFDETSEEVMNDLGSFISDSKARTLATLGERPQGQRPPLSSFFEKKR